MSVKLNASSMAKDTGSIFESGSNVDPAEVQLKEDDATDMLWIGVPRTAAYHREHTKEDFRRAHPFGGIAIVQVGSYDRESKKLNGVRIYAPDSGTELVMALRLIVRDLEITRGAAQISADNKRRAREMAQGQAAVDELISAGTHVLDPKGAVIAAPKNGNGAGNGEVSVSAEDEVPS